MAITQVTAPASVPAAIADYQAQNAHISAFNMIVNNQPFILTNSENTSIPAIAIGSYIQFGGNLYIVDTEDYAITGTPVDGNNYIRLSGTTTLTAEWIQDISSYVWNPVYGYKYTGSYAILPYLVVKASTEYAKYSLAMNASFDKLKATSLDTGQGANELYAMNQNVRTSDSPNFVEITTTNGPNKPVDNNDASMPAIGVGGFTFGIYTNTTIENGSITLPVGGAYICAIYVQRGEGNVVQSISSLRASGGTTFAMGDNYESGSYIRVSAWRIA